MHAWILMNGNRVFRTILDPDSEVRDIIYATSLHDARFFRSKTGAEKFALIYDLEGCTPIRIGFA